MFTAPKRKPQEFGFSPKDYHLVVNAEAESLKGFNYNGILLFSIKCRANGITADWRAKCGDTPPGLYKLGAIYDDYGLYGPDTPYDRTLLAYGWVSFDLIDLEGNEDNNGRAGLMLHGGGSACGWPAAWSPYQTLYDTLGCIRCKNSDLKEHILPLPNRGEVYVSVWQDDR
jgi:hypothetical protein